MSIWQKLTDIFRPTYHISFDMADAMTIIQGQSETELYKTQPHLRTVISFLADNVAQVGLKEFRRISDTDRQRITDSPLINLLKQPNPDMTGFELLRQLTADLALHDVAYWIVTQAPDRDMERFGGWQIRPIPPSWVTAKQEGSVFAPASYRVDTGLGRGWIDVPAEDMLVFHGWNPTDPTNGVTPVMALKDIINEQIQAWSYRTQTWQRGGRVGTVLVRPKDAPPWDDTARERFARGWKEFTDKGARAGSTPLLEDGMELKRLGFNAREEEFSEVTKLSLQTVASIYHVSPVMVGILDNANFSNTKEFRKMLYSETLGPTMRMIEDRLNTFLATMIGADPLDYVEFDIRAKLSGDFEEQASVLIHIGGSHRGSHPTKPEPHRTCPARRRRQPHGATQRHPGRPGKPSGRRRPDTALIRYGRNREEPHHRHVEGNARQKRAQQTRRRHRRGKHRLAQMAERAPIRPDHHRAYRPIQQRAHRPGRNPQSP